MLARTPFDVLPRIRARMLGDGDIERAARQLATYREGDKLAEILDDYSKLIEDYKRLKSDYEEERDARERYKQQAKGGERNPFVVVLIDGDGYVFHQNFAAMGPMADEGGSNACKRLNDCIRASLERKGLGHCQIIVRIYANVTGLSKTMARTGLAGKEKRSLATFIAGFNRSYGLTDFVDAGELKENADFKLRALLGLYADNSQCKHVFFGACHDVGYISDLTPYRGNRGKFTLITAPGTKFHDEFAKLGMSIEELPDVFRATPLDEGVAHRLDSTTALPTRGAPLAAKSSNAQPHSRRHVPDEQQASSSVCRFYPIGKCKYGQSCKNAHVGPVGGGDAAINGPEPGAKPFKAPPLDRFSKMGLPRRQNVPEGHLPVNAKQFRLDPYIPLVSPDTMSALKTRIDQRRVCNNFHLNAFCPAGDSCEYDHSPLDDEAKQALEFIARSNPCHRRGACRVPHCFSGHICQVSDCIRRGGKAFCKLPMTAHLEDLTLHEYVPDSANNRHDMSPSNESGVNLSYSEEEEDHF